MKILLIIISLVLSGCGKMSVPKADPAPYNSLFLYRHVWNEPRNVYQMANWCEFFGSGTTRVGKYRWEYANSNPPLKIEWLQNIVNGLDGPSMTLLKSWLADAAKDPATPAQTKTPPQDHYFVEYGGSDPVSQKPFVLTQIDFPPPVPPATYPTNYQILYTNPSVSTYNMTTLTNQLCRFNSN